MRRSASWTFYLSVSALAGCSSTATPTCGAQGQLCCNSSVCNAGLACLADVCTNPGGGGGGGGGGTGSSVATSGSSGRSGTSTPPGGSSTNSGAGGSSSGGTSSNAPACGGLSQTCCAGGACNGSLVCQGGSCAQPTAGVAGTPCAKNSDCPTGICLPVGQPAGAQPPGEATWTGNVCSESCDAATGCVAGWSCAALIGQSSNVCQCQYSPEICDGKDNDCNGIVDDEPQADQACQRQNSLDVCQQGACVCAAQNQCGGSCVDLQTDASSCGQCGNICPTGASCNAGNCVCPGDPLVCDGVCVGQAPGVHDCSGSCASNSSVQSCGTSCTPCPTVANGTATCDGTSCGIQCGSGYVPCTGQCCQSCATAGCEGSTYCDLTSGLCVSGCDTQEQCDAEEGDFCNLNDNSCEPTVCYNSCPGYTYDGECSDGTDDYLNSGLPSGTTYPLVDIPNDTDAGCPDGTTDRGQLVCGPYANLVCVPD